MNLCCNKINKYQLYLFFKFPGNYRIHTQGKQINGGIWWQRSQHSDSFCVYAAEECSRRSWRAPATWGQMSWLNWKREGLDSGVECGDGGKDSPCIRPLQPLGDMNYPITIPSLGLYHLWERMLGHMSVAGYTVSHGRAFWIKWQSYFCPAHFGHISETSRGCVLLFNIDKQLLVVNCSFGLHGQLATVSFCYHLTKLQHFVYSTYLPR